MTGDEHRDGIYADTPKCEANYVAPSPAREKGGKMDKFEIVCAYAQRKIPKRKDIEKSRAKDMSRLMFKNPWARDNKHHIVLYETDKQIARGKDKPEVYWVVLDEDGRVRKMPARNIRQMDFIPGFVFAPGVYDHILSVLFSNKEDIKNETEESGTHQ